MAPGNWALGLYHLLNQLYGRVNEGAASLWELSSDAAPSSVLMSYYVLLDDLQGIFGKQKKYIKVNFSIWSDGVVCFTLFVPGLYLYTCIDLHVLNHTVLLEGIQLDYSIQSFNVLNSVCKYFYWFVWGGVYTGHNLWFLGIKLKPSSLTVSALCYPVSLSVHSYFSEDFYICVHQGNLTIVSLPSFVLG